MFVYEIKDQLKFSNLLSWRNAVPVDDVSKAYSDGKNLIIKNKAEKTGPIISCVHAISRVDNTDYVDFEYMIPVSNSLNCTVGFSMLKEFVINNVLICYFEGTSIECNLHATEIKAYMDQHNYEQTTPAYNVLWEENDYDDTIKVSICFGIKQR